MQSEDEKAIEATFVESWYRREEFYDNFIKDDGWNWLAPAKAFVRELRNRGYNRKLLVTKPYHLFILARTRLRDLRSEQTSLICFKFRSTGAMRVRYYETGNLISEFDVERIEITPEIEALLERLLAQPID
jgi:hypothetical protein